MTPFKENATCPKCGDGFIAAQYYPQHEDRWVSNVGDEVASERREHIRRRCRRCGYQWNEAPLDAALEGEKNE